MGVRFACHGCGKQLNVKQELAGRRGVCPECSMRFRIPLGDSESSIPIKPAQPTTSRSSGTPLTKSPLGKGNGKVYELIANDPDATWYVRPPSGGQYGPADGELLKQWIGEGRVAATALIWRDGWPQWRAASEALPEIGTSPIVGQTVGVLPSTAAEKRSTPPVTPISSAAPSPGPAPSPVPTPQVAGQSGIGAARRSRSLMRVFWIGMLSLVAIALAGLLYFLVNRPVS